MARFPEIQKKAQAEVDALTGGKRLPTMADRPKLPYVDAVLSEVLRWVSIAPVSECLTFLDPFACEERRTGC